MKPGIDPAEIRKIVASRKDLVPNIAKPLSPRRLDYVAMREAKQKHRGKPFQKRP